MLDWCIPVIRMGIPVYFGVIQCLMCISMVLVTFKFAGHKTGMCETYMGPEVMKRSKLLSALPRDTKQYNPQMTPRMK